MSTPAGHRSPFWTSLATPRSSITWSGSTRSYGRRISRSSPACPMHRQDTSVDWGDQHDQLPPAYSQRWDMDEHHHQATHHDLGVGVRSGDADTRRSRPERQGQTPKLRCVIAGSCTHAVLARRDLQRPRRHTHDDRADAQPPPPPPTGSWPQRAIQLISGLNDQPSVVECLYWDFDCLDSPWIFGDNGTGTGSPDDDFDEDWEELQTVCPTPTSSSSTRTTSTTTKVDTPTAEPSPYEHGDPTKNQLNCYNSGENTEHIRMDNAANSFCNEIGKPGDIATQDTAFTTNSTRTGDWGMCRLRPSLRLGTIANGVMITTSVASTLTCRLTAAIATAWMENRVVG